MMSAPEPDPDPSVIWAPPTVAELRSLLPHYAVSRMLGRGGMGAVFLGRQEQLDRDVAIKILLEPSQANSDDLDFSGRFRQEARAMARLDHPAIVPVYDFGTTSAGHTWELGSNENTNGLLRQYLPKGTDLAGLTQGQCNRLAAILNNRPRKRLGYKTPNEVYFSRRVVAVQS